MQVRNRFTLWLSLTAAVASVISSSFVIHEGKEEIHELVNYELSDIAESIFTEIGAATDESRAFNVSTIHFPISRYWLRIIDTSGQILYTTKLARQVGIPIRKTDKSYHVAVEIPHELLWIPSEELKDMEEIANEKVQLHVRYITKDVRGENYSVLIGRPLLLESAELKDIFQELAIGICIIILLIVVMSYIVSGRILKPISDINQMIRKIRETSLDKRIPLGKSKDELYELAASLNSMFDRLQYSFQQQRNFVGNAAHEMKSPLTILMLGHENMLAGNPDQQIRNSLEKQLNSMRRLNKLIRDLLSIARLEQQETLNREPVDISELINGILEDYLEVIRAKKIHVTTFLKPVTINVDQEKITRLFINLIDNAIKYNHQQNGILEISASMNRDYLEIQVINGGEGIPSEDIPHIFDQFHRVEKSRSQTYGGAGLGLTIARRIIVMHGGTVEVTSDRERTTFRVSLSKGWEAEVQIGD